MPDRIVLIHALADSIQPIHDAFARQWPEADYSDLLDTSLAVDLATAGELTAAMRRRFLTLGTYAADQVGTWKTGQAASPSDIRTAAILFTCSAFGPAIDGVKAALSIPVLKPNESAFAAAIKAGPRIGLLVTFLPSLVSLRDELQELANQKGLIVDIQARYVDGALAALKAGDVLRHDGLIAEAAAALPPHDVLILGQFSMARAASSMSVTAQCPVITTPGAAVLALRQMLGDQRKPAD